MKLKGITLYKKKSKSNILEDSSFVLPHILTNYSDEELFLEFRVGRVNSIGAA